MMPAAAMIAAAIIIGTTARLFEDNTPAKEATWIYALCKN
jgi:hypothetical protein